MIQITLIVEGKSQTYKAAGMNLGASMLAYDLFRAYEKAEGDYTQDLLDSCMNFITEIFGHSFTVRELCDGYKGSAFVLFPNILRAAVGYVDEQIINFPTPPETAEAEKIAS